MKAYRIIYIFLALVITSCGSVQKAANNASATAKKASVVKAHTAARTDFKTMKSRLSVSYKDEKQSRNVTVDLRIEKGKQIWMSAKFLGFTAAKIYITPDRVQFYEKLKGRSFDGDFSLISDFLGEPLEYQQLEDLLLGQAVESLQPHDFSIVDNQYQFKQGQLIEKLFKLRPSDFKLSQQSIRKPADDSFLVITYPDYQVVDKRIIPLEVKVDAKRGKRLSQVILEFKNIEFNQDLSFPFSIPSNSKPMNL
ncbi:DUF4292 domain-containing protein [Nonlabens ulvanivorans]|uniref:Deoxyuridine 5'-triphosphate nucleotidohydrolase n=1 Tax=Nonlabens ulvanivorans TaxID=906888 RepID=A0A084JUB5_NONUL|nr:DUF4292 domain-containing protein [Nonlabens ulvanivorans]KEZ92549.1 deoxyuridine 5'-triphosphate nucleotidohydrolase [Nonlabens ulvanivorans]PRX15387.1 uncharacterized protein DUF4292 [Nonlabens ulvanivorans]WOI22262.1 DUF4292 domain-containing protein [Nonlabens ulvanivorans]GAL73800.1 hypothetical protein JCM19275_2647 [Nonlabens ulvanivorans]